MKMDGSVNPYRGIIKNPNNGRATMPLAEEIVYTLPVLVPALSAVADTLRTRNVGTMPRNSSGGRTKAMLTRMTAAPALMFAKAIVNSGAVTCISSRNTDAASNTHNRGSGLLYLSAITPPAK
jgi:hypothetical protein